MSGICRCGARAHFGYGPPLFEGPAWYCLEHRPDGGAPITDRMLKRRAVGVYYNDNDSFACAWLRELVKARLLPEGQIDGRSVTDIRPAKLAGFKHCHLFAGIGGWPHALALAGWPDDWEVWTASLPCQPFSSAGRHLGDLDGRHLWPAFYRLVVARRPATIIGEQVVVWTWREQDMPAGPPICQLAPWARRSSASGYSGSPLIPWPTPKKSDADGGRTTKTAGGGDSHLQISTREAAAFGTTPSSSWGPTENPGGSGRTNPAFVAWLMGYMPDWIVCGMTASGQFRF
jgi:hypothetical protein